MPDDTGPPPGSTHRVLPDPPDPPQPSWAAIASGSPESPLSPPTPQLVRYSAMHLTEGKALDPSTLPVKVVREKTDALTVAFDTPEKATLADFAQALTEAGFTECIISHSTRTRVATARLPTQEDWNRIQGTTININGEALPLRRIRTFDPHTTSIMLRNVYGHSASHMATAIRSALEEHGTVVDIILGRIAGQTTKNAWALIQLPDPSTKLPTTIEINGDTVSLIGTAVTEACRYCRQPDHTINECMSHPGNKRRNAKKPRIPGEMETTDKPLETQKRTRPIRQLRQPSQPNPAPIATPNQFAALAVEDIPEVTPHPTTPKAPTPPASKNTPTPPPALQTFMQEPPTQAPIPTATHTTRPTQTETAHAQHHRVITRTLGHFLPPMADTIPAQEQENHSPTPHPDDMEITSPPMESPTHFEEAPPPSTKPQPQQTPPNREPGPPDIPSMASHQIYQPTPPYNGAPH
ncbi:hypothetical protein IW150_002710, partial [Coemansia sp. RSA 2607]